MNNIQLKTSDVNHGPQNFSLVTILGPFAAYNIIHSLVIFNICLKNVLSGCYFQVTTLTCRKHFISWSIEKYFRT